MSRGPRVGIADLHPDHAGDLLPLLSDPPSMEAFGLATFDSAAEIRLWIRAGRRERSVTGLAVLGPAGAAIGLVRLARSDTNLFAGYAIAAEWRGRGLMREALSLVLDRCLVDETINRVIAHVAPGNAASLALLVRLGFRPTGAVRLDPVSRKELLVFARDRSGAP